MTNNEIAELFELLSKLMDIHGENSFRAKSYASAAFRLEKLDKDVMTLTDAEIQAITGIGDSNVQKIIEIKETGSLKVLSELVQRTPPGVIELLSIKGIGPKKIGALWFELGITSIDELEQACRANKLPSLKGFTTKTQEDILKNIAFKKDSESYFLWAKAAPFAESTLRLLQNKFPEELTALSGDFRRLVPTLKKIDFVTTIDTSDLQQFFKESIAVINQEENTLFIQVEYAPQFIFHLATQEDFFQKLFLTTGDQAFLNRFTNTENNFLNLQSEEEIFTKSNKLFIPAALRDSEYGISLLQQSSVPDLIQVNEIKGLIHCHSKWSDGKNTIVEMAEAAMQKGLEYMVLSDHSQAAFYANGLSPDRIMQQHKEINSLNQQLAPFKIFQSIEVDILNDGSLDYSNEVLASLDLVITSVHSNLKMKEEHAMSRLLAAICHPATNIIGHLTGRLLLMREGYPVNHKEIIKACVDNNVVIEINANPRRLDIDWTWVQFAIQQGAMLSINPDAHNIAGIDDIRYGVMAAQKAGLTAKNNLSSMSLVEFENYILSNKKLKH